MSIAAIIGLGTVTIGSMFHAAAVSENLMDGPPKNMSLEARAAIALSIPLAFGLAANVYNPDLQSINPPTSTKPAVVTQSQEPQITAIEKLTQAGFKISHP